jgi:hypothetical protein
MTDNNKHTNHHHINIDKINEVSEEHKNNHVHNHECSHNNKNEENGIITFRLGDDNHPIDEDDEVIEN